MKKHVRWTMATRRIGVGLVSFVLLAGLVQSALPVRALVTMTATKTDALQVDADGSTTVTPGDTLRYTITIQNSGDSNATNTVFNDTIDANTTFVPGSLQTTPLARNDLYSTVGNVQLTVPVGSSVLLNDADPDGSGGLTLTPFGATSANGGTVSMAADGSFTYNPAPGFSGTDTFTYSLNDGEGNVDSATVSITVGPVVWFINNAVAGPGDGRFTSPFSSIANFNSLAADDPGDYIFVYQGSGAYSGAITLLDTQQLIGHGVGLSISPNLAIAAGSRPTIANVALGSGNTVRGLNIVTNTGTALGGASVGALIVNNVAVTNSAGVGVSLVGGTASMAVTLDSVNASGGANGIVLTNNAGAFTSNGGTIDPTTGHGIQVSNTGVGPLAFTLANSTVTGAPAGFNGLDFAIPTSGSFGNVSVTSNTISNNGGTGLRANIQGTGSISKIDIGSNTFTGNDVGVDLATNGTASVDFDIHNNATMSGTRTQVNIAANDVTPNNGVGPTMEGYVRTNGITTSPTGSVYIALWVVSDGDGNITVDINNNTISNFGDSGIDVESRGGTGDVNARIANNSATTTATFPLAGMFLRSGNGTAGETSLLCVNLSANNMTGGAGAPADYYLDRFPTSAVFQIQGLSPSPATAAQAQAYVISTDSAPPATAFAATGTYTAATCGNVSFALAPTGGVFATAPAGSAEAADGGGIDVAAGLGGLASAVGDLGASMLGAMVPQTALAAAITPVSLGTMNPGQQVTITFDVTISAGFSGTQVCNQGNVTADGGINTLTDDPDTATANDPTCTPVLAPDTTDPTVTINQASGQADPTAIGPIHFTAVFDEPVTGFGDSALDVGLGGSAGATTAVVTEISPNDGTTYDVAVSGMTTSGSVTASIPADAAEDGAGNGNTASTSTDDTVTFDLDTTPPDTTIDSSPSNPSNSSSASFTFSGTDTGSGVAIFECKLDGGAFAACTSPQAYSALADGSHTFQVRAIDGAGLADPSPANYTWTIDTVAPSVTINQASGQADPTSTSPIHFTAVFDQPVTGFGDSAADVGLGGSAGATTAVVSEVAPNDGTTYDVAVSGMTQDGTVIASIPSNAATDGAGNGNTASTSTDDTVAFIFDTTPPDTTIDSAPSNPSTSTSATFTFSGTDVGTGVASFECKLDGGAFAVCTSPQSYSSLAVGSHTFQVRAIDGVGLVDPTPASYTWTIEAATSLLYNGAQIVNVGQGFQPAARLTSSAAACATGKTITFSLDADPLTGAPGAYALGSAVTNGSGQATLASVSTSGWLEGIYTIRAAFAGTVGCLPSFDEATLTVASPGNSATGGGWYTLSGSGRVNFGFNVRKTDPKCRVDCVYKGHLLLINNGKWKLKGSFDSYSKLANGQGAAGGSGDLYWWDASLAGGAGDWALAQPGVGFTANFYDSGLKGKKSTDTFGIRIVYTPDSPPEPSSLPNSAPQLLKGGDIKVD